MSAASAAVPTVCPLCAEPGGELVWQDAQLRVILAHEHEYPGFCRVVWQAHLAESAQLPNPAAFSQVLADIMIESV